MTDIVFAVIDNHRKKKGTTYNIIYHTKNAHTYVNYLRQKGLIE